MQYLAFAGFAATIPAANWMIGNVGDCAAGPCVILVGFGLYAPSGVLMVGAALVLRDLLQETAGLRWTMAAIAAGAALSFAVAPAAIALASAVAFLISETADAVVYSKLRRRGAWLAVMLSGAVGAVIDSAAFLLIAFGSLDFVAGQVVGKLWISAVAGFALAGLSRARRRMAALRAIGEGGE